MHWIMFFIRYLLSGWERLKTWLWNILISIDQLINVLLGPTLNMLLQPKHGFGYPDETLSSVFGKNRPDCKVCVWVCWLLDKVDKRHCAKTIENDEGGPPIV